MVFAELREGREGGTEIQLNQQLWFCLLFTGVLVFVSNVVALSKLTVSPSVDKNAWRALNESFTLEIFPPFSAQDKLATNPSSFLILGPPTWACPFYDNLSWEVSGWAENACQAAAYWLAVLDPPTIRLAYPWKPPEQITKDLLTALGDGKCACLSWKSDPDALGPHSCLPRMSLSFCWERMPSTWVLSILKILLYGLMTYAFI